MRCKVGMSKAFAENLVKQELSPKSIKSMGRLQFFYHSPSSEMPIRDVRNEQGHGYKTEPHLEKNAENYENECYQRTNIQGLLKNRQEYLFLFTTCRSRAPHMEKYYGERYIVGYIRADRFLARPGFVAVQGETRMVAFGEAYPLRKLDPSPKHRHFRVRTLNADETKNVLTHLRHGENIKDRCLREIERLKTGIRRREVRKCK